MNRAGNASEDWSLLNDNTHSENATPWTAEVEDFHVVTRTIPGREQNELHMF
jgi:hypothetical protein